MKERFLIDSIIWNISLSKYCKILVWSFRFYESRLWIIIMTSSIFISKRMLKKRNPGVFPLWLVLFEKTLLHRQKGFNTQCIFNIRLSSNYQMSGNLPYDWNLTPGILETPFTFLKLLFAQNLRNCILRSILITSSLDFTVKARNPPTPQTHQRNQFQEIEKCVV